MQLFAQGKVIANNGNEPYFSGETTGFAGVAKISNGVNILTLNTPVPAKGEWRFMSPYPQLVFVCVRISSLQMRVETRINGLPVDVGEFTSAVVVRS